MATTKKLTVLRLLFCDFCGKSQADCHLLIRGRDAVHICGECVDVCGQMLAEHNALKAVGLPRALDAVDPSATDPGTPTTRET